MAVPTAPFCIPDEKHPCDRVGLLDALASDGARDPAVRAAAATIQATATARCAALGTAAGRDATLAKALRVQNGCSRILASEAFRYAQSVPYVPNLNGRDCYQPASWTLVHGGECKALSVLFIALCCVVGLEAEPYWITQTGASLNHVFARVWIDGVWFWADPSLRQAQLGESPYEVLERTGSGHHVLGLAPAGRSAGIGSARGAPIARNVWPGLWGGWPHWWWKLYHPYLFDPSAGGYYPLAGVHAPASLHPAAAALAPAGCACALKFAGIVTPRSVRGIEGGTPQPFASASLAYRAYNPFALESAS